MITPNVLKDPQSISFKINFKLANVFLLGLGILFIYLAVYFGHLNEDSFIVFRSIENFMNGYGLGYNIDERSQSYTDPLWVLLHVLMRFIFNDVRLVSIGISLVSSALTFIVIARYFRKNPWLVGFLIFLPLTMSLAFLEYSTSGLENSLSHLLAALFFCIFLQEHSLKESTTEKVFLLSTIACFAVLNRFDTVLFYAVPLFYLALTNRHGFIKNAMTILWGMAPLIVWLAFSTFYYGYALPDTFYAKLAAHTPEKLLTFFGLNYYYRFVETNLSSAVAIFTAIIFSGYFIISKAKTLPHVFWHNENIMKVAVSLTSVLFYLYYCLTIGDYMNGRFFTITLLVSLILLTFIVSQKDRFWNRGTSIALMIVALISISRAFNHYDTSFIQKCTNNAHNNCSEAYEEANEVHIYRLFQQNWYLKLRDHPATDWQDLGWTRKVISELDTTPHPNYLVHYSAGVMPFYAGPYHWIVDQLGYVEPFLVRIPASQHHPGHFLRDVPKGYLKWRFHEDGTELNDNFKVYLNELRNIKSMPLFSIERIKKVAAFNMGVYDEYLNKCKESLVIHRNSTAIRCKNYSKSDVKGTRFDSPFVNYLCENR